MLAEAIRLLQVRSCFHDVSWNLCRYVPVSVMCLGTSAGMFLSPWCVLEPLQVCYCLCDVSWNLCRYVRVLEPLQVCSCLCSFLEPLQVCSCLYDASWNLLQVLSCLCEASWNLRRSVSVSVMHLKNLCRSVCHSGVSWNLCRSLVHLSRLRFLIPFHVSERLDQGHPSFSATFAQLSVSLILLGMTLGAAQ